MSETAVTEEGETKKGGSEAKEGDKDGDKEAKEAKEGAGEEVTRAEVTARSMDDVINHRGNRKHWTNPLYALVVEPGRNGEQEERDGRDEGEGGEGGEGGGGRGGSGFTSCARLRPSWNVIHLNLWKRLHLRSLPSPATLTMGPYVLL